MGAHAVSQPSCDSFRARKQPDFVLITYTKILFSCASRGAGSVGGDLFLIMEQTTCLVGGVQPLQLPWTNNSLNSDGIGSAKGIAISIGNPPQYLSIAPGINQNNTFVVNVDNCGSETNYSCIASYHGVYSPPAGVNWTSTLLSWNGTAGSDVSSKLNDDIVFFNDVFNIGGKQIPGVPFVTYTPRSDDGKYYSCEHHQPY